MRSGLLGRLNTTKLQKLETDLRFQMILAVIDNDVRADKMQKFQILILDEHLLGIFVVHFSSPFCIAYAHDISP